MKQQKKEGIMNQHRISQNTVSIAREGETALVTLACGHTVQRDLKPMAGLLTVEQEYALLHSLIGKVPMYCEMCIA